MNASFLNDSVMNDAVTLDQPFLHAREIPFGHADMAGIVYTPRFTDYCMEAAEAWLKSVVGTGWYELNQQGAVNTPVMHFDIDFKSPLVPGDTLRTTVFLTNVGSSSFSLYLKGETGEGASPREVFAAKLVLCFVDSELNKSVSIPAQYRDRMTKYKEHFSNELYGWFTF